MKKHHHMHMHMARRRMSHVIDELYTSLFHAGATEVNLHLVKETEGLRLLVKSNYAEEHQHDMDTMARMLQPEVRNPALVEEFWELAGGDQYTSDGELSLVGQMLDDAKISMENGQVEMDLYISFLL